VSKKALGKGLGAILKEACDEPEDRIHNIPLAQIFPDPEQPRKNFDKKSLLELSASIQSNGVIQPIIVSKNKENSYIIIAGERRWRASKISSLTHIPCIVRSPSREKRLEIALIENLQRENLNPIEEAKAYQVLIERLNFTQEKAALNIGKERSTITNMLRLLKLPDHIQERIRKNDITAGHARALITLEEDEKKIEFCEKIVKRSLSVRQTESMVKALKKTPARKKQKEESITSIEDKLTAVLNTRVVISGKKKGQIKVFFDSTEKLSELHKIILGCQ